MPVAVEGGLRGRVAHANHGNLLLHVREGLAVVVGDLRQVLAGHVHEVRLVEEARRDDDVARRVGILRGDDGEVAVVAADLEDAFVEVELDGFALGHAPVVLDRLFAGRLVALHGEGIAANLDQLWRREELHVRGIADDGVDERALLDHRGLQSLAARFDGARQPDGACADDDDVLHQCHSIGAAGDVRGYRIQKRRTTEPTKATEASRPPTPTPLKTERVCFFRSRRHPPRPYPRRGVVFSFSLMLRFFWRSGTSFISLSGGTD